MNVSGKHLEEVQTSEGLAVRGEDLAAALGSSPVEEARRLLEEDKAVRVNNVAEALQKALDENRCVLRVAITITDKGNFPELRIVPAELD